MLRSPPRYRFVIAQRCREARSRFASSGFLFHARPAWRDLVAQLSAAMQQEMEQPAAVVVLVGGV
jgi:hypothetical protein